MNLNLTDQERRDLIHIAQRHGTTAAADWIGASTNTIRTLRKAHDPTYTRGRGAPTRDELARSKPDPTCNCARCRSHYRTLQIRQDQAYNHRRFIALNDKPVWTNQANCRGMDPELWFPGRGLSLSRLKEICASCTVREQCLEAGIDEKFGVWGGKSERERRRLRRAPRIQEAS